MNNSSVAEIKPNVAKKEHINFCWKDNLPIQNLLDVISSVLADEYIAVTRQNHDVFLNTIPRSSELRGCALSGQGDTK